MIENTLWVIGKSVCLLVFEYVFLHLLYDFYETANVNKACHSKFTYFYLMKIIGVYTIHVTYFQGFICADVVHHTSSMTMTNHLVKLAKKIKNFTEFHSLSFCMFRCCQEEIRFNRHHLYTFCFVNKLLQNRSKTGLNTHTYLAEYRTKRRFFLMLFGVFDCERLLFWRDRAYMLCLARQLFHKLLDKVQRVRH